MACKRKKSFPFLFIYIKFYLLTAVSNFSEGRLYCFITKLCFYRPENLTHEGFSLLLLLFNSSLPVKTIYEYVKYYRPWKKVLAGVITGFLPLSELIMHSNSLFFPSFKNLLMPEPSLLFRGCFVCIRVVKLFLNSFQKIQQNTAIRFPSSTDLLRS